MGGVWIFWSFGTCCRGWEGLTCCTDNFSQGTLKDWASRLFKTGTVKEDRTVRNRGRIMTKVRRKKRGENRWQAQLFLSFL